MLEPVIKMDHMKSDPPIADLLPTLAAPTLPPSPQLIKPAQP